MGELSSSSERQEYEFWSGVGPVEYAGCGWWSILSELVNKDVLVTFRVQLRAEQRPLMFGDRHVGGDRILFYVIVGDDEKS